MFGLWSENLDRSAYEARASSARSITRLTPHDSRAKRRTRQLIVDSAQLDPPTGAASAFPHLTHQVRARRQRSARLRPTTPRPRRWRSPGIRACVRRQEQRALGVVISVPPASATTGTPHACALQQHEACRLRRPASVSSAARGWARRIHAYARRASGPVSVTCRRLRAASQRPSPTSTRRRGGASTRDDEAHTKSSTLLQGGWSAPTEQDDGNSRASRPRRRGRGPLRDEVGAFPGQAGEGPLRVHRPGSARQPRCIRAQNSATSAR